MSSSLNHSLLSAFDCQSKRILWHRGLEGSRWRRPADGMVKSLDTCPPLTSNRLEMPRSRTPVELSTDMLIKLLLLSSLLFLSHSKSDMGSPSHLRVTTYVYQLMEELFRDSMYILMDTITEYTLPFLYELFWSFENDVIEGIATRPEIFWSSISAIHPPKEFLLKFAEKLEHRYKNVSYRYVDTDELSSYDPSYVIRSLVNLDEDLEDAIWNSLRKSLDDPLTSWYSDAMKKKEEKRAERKRRSSHTFRPDSMSMTSSPIPIGGRPKTESFSKSLNSPVARSPLAQSMSPLGKALPTLKLQPRNDSISNSFEDFPEVGFSLSTTKSSSGISPGGRFAPKGTKFKKDFEILKPATPANPWKSMSPSTSSIREEIEVKEVVNFDEVVRKEEKLQKNIRTGFKKVQLLPHVELEELAVAQILEVFGQELHNEAIINVELVNDDNFDVENEQNVWGNMPGLVRR